LDRQLDFIDIRFLGGDKKIWSSKIPSVSLYYQTDKDMKNFTISITKEQIRKMNKAASRNAEIESGIFMPTSRVYKSEKAYNRKPKYKTEWV
jgi:hypothetical protein